MFSVLWPPSSAANGIVSYVANLRESLRALGFRVHVLVPRLSAPEEGVFDLTPHLRASVPRYLADRLLGRLAPTRTLALRMGLCIGSAVRRLEREQGVELVEMEETFGSAYYLRRFVSVPTIVRAHGPWFLNGPAMGVAEDRASAARNVREGRAILRADAVTAPSRDVLARVQERFQVRLPHAYVVPNPGPDIPRERVWNATACDPNLLLFVGRFDRHKGGDLAIRAFACLQRRYPNLRLAFVGPDGPLLDERGGRVGIRDFLQEVLPDPELRSRVDVLGRLPPSQIAELRQRAFLTMVPSRYETFSMTAVEALAFGSPLVASDTGGISDVVTHDRSGLRFRPGDVEDLVQKLASLLENRDLAGRLAHGAREAYEGRFAPALVAAQTAGVYDEVIARGRRVG